MGVTLWVRLCGHYSWGVFNCLNRLGNVQLAVIRSIEVAVLQGFTYSGSLRKFNWDQGCWPIYCRWPLLRGDRYEGFHYGHLDTRYSHLQLPLSNHLAAGYKKSIINISGPSQLQSAKMFTCNVSLTLYIRNCINLVNVYYSNAS